MGKQYASYMLVRRYLMTVQYLVFRVHIVFKLIVFSTLIRAVFYVASLTLSDKEAPLGGENISIRDSHSEILLVFFKCDNFHKCLIIFESLA
jgi:hypothetical protein